MKKINVRLMVLAIIILLAGLSRLVVHFHNFTPIGAMALFGGVYFSDKWKAYLLPLASLFISDLLLQGIVYGGQYGFPLYDGWYWVYGIFVVIVAMGTLVKKTSFTNIVLLSIGASVAHWVISDFGVWMSGMNPLYTKDWNGLVLCYTMALPFLQNFLLGTLMYSAIFFGVFEFAQRRFPSLATKLV
jgi:hypothetical protein